MRNASVPKCRTCKQKHRQFDRVQRIEMFWQFARVLLVFRFGRWDLWASVSSPLKYTREYNILLYILYTHNSQQCARHKRCTKNKQHFITIVPFGTSILLNVISVTSKKKRLHSHISFLLLIGTFSR